MIPNEYGTLVTPSHSKHIWKLDEIHLRSLLVNNDGEVISSGFPKFFNYSEVDEIDELFTQRFEQKQVTFTEKLDGSLIIADKWSDYHVHFRTRGNSTLGDFAPPINKLLREKYVNVMPFLFSKRAVARHSPLLNIGDYSYLFEYVGPENQIVIAYAEPQLVFLGMVDKRTLKIVTDQNLLQLVSTLLHMVLPPTYHMKRSLPDVMTEIRKWKNREGVVANFLDNDGNLTLLKIKSEQYVKLHAMKFNMTERKSQQLAFIVGIQTEDDILPILSHYGIDFEMSQYILPAIRAYLTKEANALNAMSVIQQEIDKWRLMSLTRKDFVFRLKEYLAKYPCYFENSTWFNVAIKLWDNRDDEAKHGVYGIVLDEPVPIIRTLIANRAQTIADLLTTQVEDDI